MFEVIFKLIDFDSQFLLVIRVKIDLLVEFFEIFVVLRIIFLKRRLMLLKFNARLSQLLSQLFNVNCLNTEVASHSQVSVLYVH